MMTYMKSVKRTIANWINENKKLAYTLGGAIGLPLIMAAGIGLFFGILFVLSLIFGMKIAAALMIVMPIGAGVGYYLYSIGNND